MGGGAVAARVAVEEGEGDVGPGDAAAAATTNCALLLPLHRHDAAAAAVPGPHARARQPAPTGAAWGAPPIIIWRSPARAPRPCPPAWRENTHVHVCSRLGRGSWALHPVVRPVWVARSVADRAAAAACETRDGTTVSAPAGQPCTGLALACVHCTLGSCSVWCWWLRAGVQAASARRSTGGVVVRACGWPRCGAGWADGGGGRVSHTRVGGTTARDAGEPAIGCARARRIVFASCACAPYNHEL